MGRRLWLWCPRAVLATLPCSPLTPTWEMQPLWWDSASKDPTITTESHHTGVTHATPCPQGCWPRSARLLGWVPIAMWALVAWDAPLQPICHAHCLF